MSVQVKFRRGTTIEHATFTGGVGEVTVDTTKDTLVVHDGVKAGGNVILTEDEARTKFVATQENGSVKDMLTCIPRINGSGDLGLVIDSEHAELGVAGVGKVGDFIMRVNYADTYTKVNHLSVTVDDALCKYGVVTGASVGLAYSDFTAYAQISGVVDASALTFTGSGLFPNGAAVTVTSAEDVIIVDHDNHAFTNDACVVTQRYALGTMTKFGVSQNAAQINIIPFTSLEGCLGYDGANFVIDPAKPWGVSDAQGGITFEWDSTVSGLKVTHPQAADFALQVTPRFGGYSNINAEATTLTTFHVYFFSATGVQLTSPTTAMKINFNRGGCQVRGKIPFGAKFHMRAGISPIRSANIGSVSGNNFWVSGLMQK